MTGQPDQPTQPPPDLPPEDQSPPLPPGPPLPPDPDSAGWQRLDARMMLVDPVRTIGRVALPALVGLVGVSTSRDGDLPPTMLPLILAIAVAVGLVPWLTTWYRIGDAQLQVRRGLMNRTLLTAPLDRVRSVDLEAPLLHRLLGVTRVRIGTGVDDTRIELEALSVADADKLRRFLLARSEVAAGLAGGDRPTGDGAGPATPGVPGERPGQEGVPAPVELARIDWSWLRFAPFSLSRLVIVAGALGILAEFRESLPFLRGDWAESTGERVLAFSPWLVLLAAVAAVLLAWLLVSGLGYVVQWWDLRLVRERGTLRLTHGLFTARSTTVEDARVRGVELSETVLLQLVGGAELVTLATGVGSGGVTRVLPPSPRAVDVRVGEAVLGTSGALTVPLVTHGPAARRRCHFRAQQATLWLTGGVLAAALALDLPWWLPVVVLVAFAGVGVALAERSYHHLGHRLTVDHLVAGQPSARRVRTVLDRGGIIGWVVRETWLQRRRGLATLVATTAAGAERVVVVDVPVGTATAVARAATPGLLDEFLV
jgi:putative membrane protein